MVGMFGDGDLADAAMPLSEGGPGSASQAGSGPKRPREEKFLSEHNCGSRYSRLFLTARMQIAFHCMLRWSPRWRADEKSEPRCGGALFGCCFLLQVRRAKSLPQILLNGQNH